MNLLEPIVKTLLNGVRTYTNHEFKKYHASIDQCQRVHRMMEDTLLGTKRLFNVSKPTQALKSDLRIMLQQLSQETRKLDDMTIRLPLMRLQREQRHVFRHAVWLLGYLNSHLTDNDGEFFLFLHDVAMGSDDKVLDMLTSFNDRKKCSRGRLQAISPTCP